MRIAILIHLEKENGKSYDVVADQVSEGLRQSGHDVSLVAVHGNPRKLIAGVSRRKPEVIFNLMEMFGENPLGASGVAGLLDLLDIPYTGGGPGEPRGFDQLGADLFEQVPPFLGRDRLDQLLLGLGQDSVQTHHEQINSARPSCGASRSFVRFCEPPGRPC